MNSNRHFDEHIKTQFGNYEPDVHPRIWENIVGKKDKKRPAGFWVSMFNNRNRLLFLGLIIALSSGGAWVYFNNNSSVLTNPEKSTAAFKGNKNKTTVPDQAYESVSEQPLPDSETLNEAGKNPDQSGSSFQMQITAPAPQVDTDEKNSSNKSYGNRKFITGLANVLVNTTSPLVETDEDVLDGTLLGRLQFNAEKYTVKRNAEKKERLRFNPIFFLPDCPIEKDASGNKKYFEFYGGPDYAFRTLQDTANSDYLQKRKESSAFKSAFSAGVRYTKVFNNSMSVRGGVNYSQINEKFTVNQGNIIQVVYIINNNGDTIGSYTTTGTRHKTTINRYRSIDIPVSIGYEMGNGKLHVNVNAGAVINLYSWQKGDVLDTAGNPVSITTGKGSPQYQFKTNAGVGFIGAVSVYYKLNDRLHLMAEPYFRYNFTPMNNEGSTLKQKYQTAGLRLGIRLDLK